MAQWGKTIAIDVETMIRNDKGIYEYILDATGDYFVLGCIMDENGKHETFTSKEEMWNKVLEIGKLWAKKGQKLRVYGHNMRYDFYNICNKKDKGLKWFSEEPFIVSYFDQCNRDFKNEELFSTWAKYAEKEEIPYEAFENSDGTISVEYKKEIIKFLDTFSIFRMSLKRMGDIIKCPKMEMPMKEWKYMSFQAVAELGQYCLNDCKVTLEAVKYIKQKLKDDGITLRNICTINQIAINYVINELKNRNADHILKKNKYGELTEYTHRTRFKNEIHQAYRASLCRAWKLGKIEHVYDIDCNSLYPYSLTKIRMPNLSTERKIKEPLRLYTEENLLNTIGISKVLIKNNSNKIGLIPIRTNTKVYVPKEDKYIIGVYTNLELREAVQEGYEIIDIEWSILYDEGQNVLKDIYLDLYKKRTASKDAFDYFFYKSIMNTSLGKFGQKRINQELFIDSIEKASEYKKRNIEVLKGVPQSTDVMYKKEDSGKLKKYYAPIIPTLVTAYSRVYMYRIFKAFGQDRLIYTDTDSVIFTGNEIPEGVKIGKELGEFKFERDFEGNLLFDKTAIIWGTKAKSVGNKINVSGAYSKALNMEDFEKGIAKVKKIKGIKNQRSDGRIGEFYDEERDLTEQKQRFEEFEVELDNERMYLDYGVDDVEFFIKDINRILEEK